MSRPPEFILWCDLVGHSIVFILWMYFVLQKIKLIMRFLRCTCIISLWEGLHIYIHSLTLIVGIFTGIRKITVIAASSGSVLNRTEVLLKFFHRLLTSFSFFLFSFLYFGLKHSPAHLHSPSGQVQPSFRSWVFL